MMAKNNAHLPFMIIYGVLTVLIVWMLYITVIDEPRYDEWVCIQEQCISSEPAGEQWASQNCAEVNNTQTGEQQVVCQVNIDGQAQVIPLSEINLSSNTTCTEAVCVQEVPVRNLQTQE